jgi:muramoyltetrapeptide carboxypeptidase
MIFPPFLKPGDTIGICAPARKVSREETKDGIAFLQSNGFNTLESPNLYGEFHQFSGTDHERRADLQYMLDHPGVKAIISARGGYGCVRLVDGLDWNKFLQDPKWLIGFSDVTVLHAQLMQLGVAAIHGPMLFNFSKEKIYHPAADHLIQLIKGQREPFHLTADHKVHAYNRTGEARGKLVGGNLSIIYSLGGSLNDLVTNDSILFLEDLDEYLYHIDRMMMQLLRSGKIAKLRGLIVGGMNDMKDNAVPFGETAEQIIRRICEPFSFPVWFGFPAGHIPENHPLLFGAEVHMMVNDTLTLNYVRIS